MNSGDFPAGSVVKNPPSDAGDTSATLGGGTKIPCATGQLSPRAAMKAQCSQKKSSNKMGA